MCEQKSLACNNGKTHPAFANTVHWIVLLNVPFALDSARGSRASYLPISRCWRGGNCSTSWTNSATFGCDLDYYLCSFSLAHRNSCMMYGWPLTSDARFLNRPCDCVKHKKNKQHDRSVPQVDLASIWSGTFPLWPCHALKDSLTKYSLFNGSHI